MSQPEDAIALQMFVDALRACSDPTKRRAADVIDELRHSISDSKPKWRDADRDPPADGQKVLACWHGSSCIEGMETLIYRAADEPGGSERWLDVWSDMRDPPTHWTVLPEAP